EPRQLDAALERRLAVERARLEAPRVVVARRRALELGDQLVGAIGPLLVQPVERLQRVIRERILARRPRVQIGRRRRIALAIGDAAEPVERAPRLPPAVLARKQRQLLLEEAPGAGGVALAPGVEREPPQRLALLIARGERHRQPDEELVRLRFVLQPVVELGLADARVVGVAVLRMLAPHLLEHRRRLLRRREIVETLLPPA